MEMINISEIVPPPIGTAVTNKLANKAIPRIPKISPAVDILVPNKHTKNMILNTEPMMEPSL